MWPLTRTPKLEPHVDLSPYYPAAWPDACKATPSPNVPKPIVAYAAAWCGPLEDRADALAVLPRAAFRGAIEEDLADVLAATGDGNPMVWLDTHGLATLAMFEAVAATEIATGRPATWLTKAFAVRSDMIASLPQDDTCRLYGLIARDGDNADLAIGLLRAAPAGDEVCEQLAEAVSCKLVTGASSSWTTEAEVAASLGDDLRGCGTLAFRDPRTTSLGMLYATLLVERWPPPTADAERWLEVARIAVRYQWWAPELEAVATAALANALATGECIPAFVKEASAIARELQTKTDRPVDRGRDARLAKTLTCTPPRPAQR
jgi:hypothetical protein